MKLAWSGGREPHLSGPAVSAVGPVSVGRYGGHAATKNEDGALVWSGSDWVFAVMLDGHAGSASVDAMLALFGEAEAKLIPLCEAANGTGLLQLQRELIGLLTDGSTNRRMAAVRGETACLVCYQAGPHLLWLSIGDNTLYLLHPELGRLGQHTLTARNYFEWIGERNSLSGDIPYFSTGTRQLRQGRNSIVLATDGIQEVPGTPFEPPSAFAEAFLAEADPARALERMLAIAQAGEAPDSCTLIAWQVDNPAPGLMPSG